MEPGRIALMLMDLHGKLRRATDPQVRLAIEATIDRLISDYEREQRAILDRLSADQSPQEPRAKR